MRPPRPGPPHPSRLTLSSFLSPLPAPSAGIPPWPRRLAEEKQVGWAAAPRRARLSEPALAPPGRAAPGRAAAMRRWLPCRSLGTAASRPGLGVLALPRLASAGNRRAAGLSSLRFALGSAFFAVPLGVSGRAGWRKAERGGLAKAVQHWEHVCPSRPALRSADAQAQPQSCQSPLLAAVTASHAARAWASGNICSALQSKQLFEDMPLTPGERGWGLWCNRMTWMRLFCSLFGI